MSVDATRFTNLIGGEWRPSETDRWVAVRNPADMREVVAEVPAVSQREIGDFYEAAADGARRWAATSPVVRGRVLLAAAQLLVERADAIAYALTREMGKTLSEARAEVYKAADFFAYYGGLGRAPMGELLADERQGVRVWVQREPVGVVLAISPWNDPLLTPARKLAPALIAGNSVILKPASYTPVVSMHLARALTDAGLPAGVLGTVTGSASEISAALLTNPTLSAISFTGSNAVGESIRSAIVGTNTKLLGELGGKNAAVVLEAADIDKAVAQIAAAAFAQSGQRCTATSRVIVAREIHAQVRDGLAHAAHAIVVGDGLDERTTMGPVVSLEHQAEILGFVERALDQGAVAATKRAALADGRLAHGCFVPPTVLEVEPDAEIWREEVFGPVIAIVAVDSLGEAIDLVNDSAYGLSAAVFTDNISEASAFIDGVEVGQVAVNLPTSGWDVHMPFGGYKTSSFGSKEQGLEGLNFYTRVKTVAVGT